MSKLRILFYYTSLNCTGRSFKKKQSFSNDFPHKEIIWYRYYEGAKLLEDNVGVERRKELDIELSNLEKTQLGEMGVTEKQLDEWAKGNFTDEPSIEVISLMLDNYERVWNDVLDDADSIALRKAFEDYRYHASTQSAS
ncbi:MAG: hypothetical protein FWB91_07935 [Defluviitaleaceae bacterium]|nr:hypothetical protein [Defluviitaleaceae bacterium]